MKHEKLMRAMSEIDEDLILEAHEERRATTLWIRFAACAACFAILVLIAPRLARFAEDSIAVGEADKEADGILAGMSPEASGEEEVPQYGLDENENAQDASSDVSSESLQNGEISKDTLTAQIKELELTKALCEQGEAYPLGTVIENEYGKVMFTNRSKSTVTMKVTLLADMKLSVFSATSGVWRLTVNGEEAEAFPDKAGVYEIVIDLSNDASLDLIYVVKFGVFSIGAE